MATPPTNVNSAERSRGRKTVTSHESFLRYANFRWLKYSLWLCLVLFIGYFAADVKPRPNGGSWYGYSLGTIGAGLIVWLALLGVRKRRITPGQWSLKAWTSAHVYLGLALIVIATLHTGFQLGWNVHSLAYALMMLVILSGIYGISVYSTLPALLSGNRKEMTQAQMMEGLRALDRQLHDTAQSLSQNNADLVQNALIENPFGGSLWSRLSGKYPKCATLRAILAITEQKDLKPQVESLLRRRKALLDQMRRHMRTKALLEVWLYFHVPATFALLGALAAHIISVFFYW